MTTRSRVFDFLPEVGDEVLIAVRTPAKHLTNRASNTSAIAAQIRTRYPQGASLIVVVPSDSVGWGPVPSSCGIIAILIGLFAPAVQAVRSGGASNLDLQTLRTALGPGGKFLVQVSCKGGSEVAIKSLD